MPDVHAHAAPNSRFAAVFKAISDVLHRCNRGSDCWKKHCRRQSCEKPCQGCLLSAVFIGAAVVARRSRPCPQATPVPGHVPPCTSVFKRKTPEMKSPLFQRYQSAPGCHSEQHGPPNMTKWWCTGKQEPYVGLTQAELWHPNTLCCGAPNIK